MEEHMLFTPLLLKGWTESLFPPHIISYMTFPNLKQINMMHS
jgi:hypothetical protein